MNSKMISAIYYRDAKLTQYEYCVLMTLACAAKDDKSLPSPSLKRIADRSGMSVRQISRTITTLSAKGILTVSKRQTASRQWCNLYRFHAEKLGSQKPIAESDYKNGGESNMDQESNMDGESNTKSGRDWQGVAKSGKESNNNNIVTNIDSNIKTIDKTIHTEEEGGLGGTSQPSRSVPKSEQDISAKEIHEESISKLVMSGLSLEVAKSKIQAVWASFRALAEQKKKEGYAGIANKRNYLVGMLVNMAKEGLKERLLAAQEQEPRITDLYDILDYLREQALKQAETKLGKLDGTERYNIEQIYDSDTLSRTKGRLWIALTEKQATGWLDEKSPVAAVRRMLGLDLAMSSMVTKITYERYSAAQRRLERYEERIPELERELEGKECPDESEQFGGYLRCKFRDLKEMRDALPRLRKTVADYESTHKQEEV